LNLDKENNLQTLRSNVPGATLTLTPSLAEFAKKHVHTQSSPVMNNTEHQTSSLPNTPHNKEGLLSASNNDNATNNITTANSTPTKNLHLQTHTSSSVPNSPRTPTRKDSNISSSGNSGIVIPIDEIKEAYESLSDHSDQQPKKPPTPTPTSTSTPKQIAHKKKRKRRSHPQTKKDKQQLPKINKKGKHTPSRAEDREAITTFENDTRIENNTKNTTLVNGVKISSETNVVGSEQKSIPDNSSKKRIPKQQKHQTPNGLHPPPVDNNNKKISNTSKQENHEKSSQPTSAVQFETNSSNSQLSNPPEAFPSKAVSKEKQTKPQNISQVPKTEIDSHSSNKRKNENKQTTEKNTDGNSKPRPITTEAGHKKSNNPKTSLQTNSQSTSNKTKKTSKRKEPHK
jgi:hypothetical protein